MNGVVPTSKNLLKMVEDIVLDSEQLRLDLVESFVVEYVPAPPVIIQVPIPILVKPSQINMVLNMLEQIHRYSPSACKSLIKALAHNRKISDEAHQRLNAPPFTYLWFLMLCYTGNLPAFMQDTTNRYLTALGLDCCQVASMVWDAGMGNAASKSEVIPAYYGNLPFMLAELATLPNKRVVVNWISGKKDEYGFADILGFVGVNGLPAYTVSPSQSEKLTRLL